MQHEFPCLLLGCSQSCIIQGCILKRPALWRFRGSKEMDKYPWTLWRLELS
jgi:hypothetical protein